ncbi:cytochrome P450 [Amycolatopsis alba]|uniref:Cytochrome P450 n=1 Tax=Amycolatopsis alba DSM 44262 TaxID=1125972 RepID=A0A229RL30_AMYAL|nr:cytochrome P450 [Amycolatopsis alba]OXM47370.1 cytochrome P450 [Amycolatopsis alba DSM 44262]
MSLHDRFAEVRSGLQLRMRGARSEIVTDPEPEWATGFHRIQDDLRQRRPVARTERFGGAWLGTRYEDVSATAHDAECFSSRAFVVGNVRPPLGAAPVGVLPPASSDLPFHRGARRLLSSAFSRASVARLEPVTRAYCHGLIDALAGRDQVEAVSEYTQLIPTHLMVTLLGFPEQDAPRVQHFATSTLQDVNVSAETRSDRAGERLTYLPAQIHDHLDHPRDDLTTRVLEAELNGRELDPLHVYGTLAALLVADIDTTASAIGAALLHLATTPADRARLVAESALLPTAEEELLRAHAPVMTARPVTRDMRWRDADMKAEDWVLMSFPSANRDPAEFDRADNRHVAFGLGIHRCIGAHLGQMELRVALEVRLERFPEFSLPDPSTVTWTAGQVRGPKTLPIHIGPAAPAGGQA